MVTRWGWDWNDDNMVPKERGDFVKYEDYQRLVNNLTHVRLLLESAQSVVCHAEFTKDDEVDDGL